MRKIDENTSLDLSAAKNLDERIRTKYTHFASS